MSKSKQNTITVQGTTIGILPRRPHLRSDLGACRSMKKTFSTTKKATASHQRAFEEIVDLIEQSRLHAAQAVNTTLIDLYWNVGKYISSKIQSEGWGKGTVLSLAAFI